MLKIITDTPTDSVLLSNVPEETPIFAYNKDNKKLRGVILLTTSGWALCLGGKTTYSGYTITRSQCLLDAADEYDFFIEEDD